MHRDLYRKATGRGGALSLAIGAALLLSGCGGGAADIQLPADAVESSSLCYGATMALTREKNGTGSVPLDAASHALHFALLGGSEGGIADVEKFNRIAARGKELQDKFIADKNAAGYAAPCAKAFPQTQASAFKGLPPDTRDTRLQCYVLSTMLLQTFAQSDIAPDPRAATWVKLNGHLEQLSNNEVYSAEVDDHIDEIAMRTLAQSVRLGPPADVMAACSERYLKD